MSSSLSLEDVARLQTLLSQFSAAQSPALSQIVSSSISTQPLATVASSSTAINLPAQSHLSAGIHQPPNSQIPTTRSGILPISHLIPSSIQQQGQQGHPASPMLQASAFNPFMGGFSLPSTSLANQARLSSANATIPRHPALARRGGRQTRHRSAASQPPILARANPQGIQNCYVEGAPVPTIRTTIRILPPVVSTRDTEVCLIVTNLMSKT